MILILEVQKAFDQTIILDLSNTLKYSYDHEILRNDIKTDSITVTIGLSAVQSYTSSSVVFGT